MVQSLQLGNVARSAPKSAMRRLNRVPLFVGISLAVLFCTVLVYGLSSRGMGFGRQSLEVPASGASASNFAEQMKRGVKDGIIGDREDQPVFQPMPVAPVQAVVPRADGDRRSQAEAAPRAIVESDEEWIARLHRDQRERFLQEQHRQRMASLQASAAALDSPLKIDIADIRGDARDAEALPRRDGTASPSRGVSDLYAAALKAGMGGGAGDPNGQTAKEDFFNSDIKELGYLPGKVVPQQSRHELKRGSVVPATLITGINSDLPGRITAQVSQHVFDSATGRVLLIPQGTKLFGRYDSKVSFGQGRVLVVWTDIIMPDGSTLQIGGMAGTDQQGYGGFADRVDNRYVKTFASAALIALIGSGIDAAVPAGSTLATQDSASDAVRRNFAESFGRVAEQTISRNLNVQPTIQIRPGYRFNVLVDQDIIFPGPYSH